MANYNELYERIRVQINAIPNLHEADKITVKAVVLEAITKQMMSDTISLYKEQETIDSELTTIKTIQNGN